MDNKLSDSLSNQLSLAALRNPQPITQVICRSAVNDSAWVKLHTVGEGTFVQLKELLVYNGDASTKVWRIAIVAPEDTDPSGTALDTPNVFLSGSLTTGESVIKELWTGLFPLWEIWAFSTAASGVNLNMCFSGLVVTTT